MNLANIYAGHTQDREGNTFTRMGKMLSFAMDNQINNQIIDEFMAIKPARQEHETREDYKNRLKFQKDLIKYRSLIYRYK